MSSSATIDIYFARKIDLAMIKKAVAILNSFGVYFYRYIAETQAAVAQREVATWADGKSESIINGDPAICMERVSEKGGHILMRSTDGHLYVELGCDEQAISLHMPSSWTFIFQDRLETMKNIAREIRKQLDGKYIRGHDETGVERLNFELWPDA